MDSLCFTLLLVSHFSVRCFHNHHIWIHHAAHALSYVKSIGFMINLTARKEIAQPMKELALCWIFTEHCSLLWSKKISYGPQVTNKKNKSSRALSRDKTICRCVRFMTTPNFYLMYKRKNTFLSIKTNCLFLCCSGEWGIKTVLHLDE